MTTTAALPGAHARTGKVFYPTSDGKPMAETDKHRDQGVYVIETLKARYADQPDVYISGNNFVFFVEGDPARRISPDAYVVFGVPMRQRDSYKAWDEGGKLPDVVFEITSRKTQKEDLEKKHPLYEQVLRVPEYFRFDPTGDYLKPRLQCHRLANGAYQTLTPVNGRIYSEQLGLELVMEGETFRFFDPDTNAFLLSPAELAQRVEAMEDENARLRQELEALRRRSDS